MTLLATYHVPGLVLEDHAIDVPLDWRGHRPGGEFGGKTMQTITLVLYKQMCMMICLCWYSCREARADRGRVRSAPLRMDGSKRP